MQCTIIFRDAFGKHKGLSIPEIVGIYLGIEAKQFMRGFTVVLMVIVGAVFIMGPAKILESLTPETLTMTFWVTGCVFVLRTGNHAAD